MSLPKFRGLTQSKRSETPDHIMGIYKNIPLDFLFEKFLEKNKRFKGDAIKIKEIIDFIDYDQFISYKFILVIINKYYDKNNPVELHYDVQIDKKDLEILIRRDKLNNLDI